ncbi:flotillin domain-containing protein [Yoonia sp.]|uniref:flotillin family protein n=1 Tax=Yoonia sp. TaxID=2212373 RepID=UPI0025CC181D|nr:flotillin domain-containing protein [Yoonia sp.]
MATALTWIILVVIAAAILIGVAAWLFERATNEVALVRTGVGGRKVVIDGGTLAIPYFHEISRVNMQTIRMDVRRSGDSSLITKDRMRVDVGAEFYASVIPEAGAITRAAQTLGKRVFQADQLKSLIDGMMIDALRSVAAQMTMDELHENRARFVAEVGTALQDTLLRYGLHLDSVSLTELDQTPFSALDENNAFNAVGMRKLAEVIAASKKERAEIQGDSDVSVRRAAMEANRRKMEIDLEERRAEIAQRQELETLMAAQLSEVAARKADSERSVAASRIKMEQDIQSAEIAREIAVAAQSESQSAATAKANMAKAAAVEAEEAISTARQMAGAERVKALALLLARQEAEAAATRAEITARSAKATAKDKAEAVGIEAQANKLAKLAEADAIRARIEAENTRSDAMIAMELEKARILAQPDIIAQMVKPAEKINAINIHQLSGAGLSAQRTDGSAAQAPLNQALDAIMGMAVQMPALQKIGDAIGIDVQKSLAPKPAEPQE